MERAVELEEVSFHACRAKGSFDLLLSPSCVLILLLLGVAEGAVNGGCCVGPV